MSAVKTSFWTGTAVAAAALAVVGGSMARQRADSGASLLPLTASRVPNPTGLLASAGKDVPEGDFFKEMVRLLKREYVEPIPDERALAYGAVKGMVQSLGDWESQFYTPEEFQALLKTYSGEYEGIGAELVFDVDARSRFDGGVLQTEETGNPAEELPIPRLRVIAVTPGGPAEKAGVEPGDVVESVDGRWVPAPEPIKRLQDLSEKMRGLSKLKPEEAKSVEDEFRKFASGLKEKWEHRLSPQKARARLAVGTSGDVKIVWRRGSETRSTTIAKAASRMAVFAAPADGPIVLPLREGDAARLNDALKGKGQAVIDLRSGGRATLGEMKAALAVVAPKGSYGVIESTRPGKDIPIDIPTGNDKPPKLTLLVDKTTTGPAEMFALALSSKGLAKLIGGPMSGDRSHVELIPLPDGSGYTLVTGTYKAEASKPAKAATPKKAASIAPKAMQAAAFVSSNVALLGGGL